MTPTKEEMRARLGQEVEGWRPEAGAEVFGKVTNVDTRTGEYGEYPYLEVDDEDSNAVVGVHAFHTVLKKEIASKRPKIGDTIGIHYFGKKQSKKAGGADFEHYKVDLYPAEPGAATSPNWDGFEEEAEGEAHESGVDLSAAFPGSTEETPTNDDDF